MIDFKKYHISFAGRQIVNMRLEVTKIEYEKDMIIITGATEIGTVKGVWKYREQPVADKGYFVELSYMKFEKKFAQSSTHILNTLMCEDVITFNGRVEDIDEDVYYIRFATDWLDMVEISDSCGRINKGDFASFSVRYDQIWIYPYD